MGRYHVDRRETELFVSGTLESLVPQGSVARLIWQALEGLDLSAFDALYRNDVTGRPAVDPRRLCGVWMLALVRGETSSVRVAHWCGQDVEFRWMLGDAPLQKSTLCDFRKERSAQLAGLSAQVLAALGRCGLLPGASVAVDGTVVRAASSCRAVKSRKQLEKRVARLKETIAAKLAEPDGAPDEVEQLSRRSARLSTALLEMKSLGLEKPEDRITVSEPQARMRRQKNGSYAPGYNVQAVTDLDSGVLVHAEVIAQGNDAGQLQAQLEKATAALCEAYKETTAPQEAGTPHTVREVAADSAYHDVRQLAALEAAGIHCIVPQDRNTHRTPPGVSDAFKADAFTYDDAADTMTCPAGQRLTRRKLNNEKTATVYQAHAKTCAACPHKPHCCPNTKEGRSVNRTCYGQVLATVAARTKSAEGLALLRARWTTAEGTFARLNGHLGMARCRLWDTAGVTAEVLWRQLTHNLMLLCGAWQPLIHPRPQAT